MLGGDGFDFVDVLAPGVKTVPDGALSVLIRQPGPRGQENRRRGVVFAGDQFERITLISKLFAGSRGDAWLDGGDDTQRGPVGLTCGRCVVGPRGGRGGRNGVGGHG